MLILHACRCRGLPKPTTGVITLVSVGAYGQGNYFSGGGTISADGTKVAFDSYANNLTLDDSNVRNDIFVKDLATGAVTLVSAGANGVGNEDSDGASISADGTKVAFYSSARNLVAADTNIYDDVYVKDLATGILTLASIGTNGPGNAGSGGASISANGTKVVFSSSASNLVAGDTNGTFDVFVKDLATGVLTLISTGANGPGNGSSGVASISADGSKVAFNSSASNLVAGDTNGKSDVFVKNLATGVVTLVSTGVNGEGNDESSGASMSADGSKVVFSSSASNLVAGDTNGEGDVFVKDLATGVIALVSVGGARSQGNDESYSASISADGGTVAFASLASNLVPGDTNGKGDVFVSTSTLPGVKHGPFLASNSFGGNASPWSSDNLAPRRPGDVNGDGRADIVGFAPEGVYTALGKTDGTFAAPKFVLADFGFDAGGWSSDNLLPREMADVNGDGRADIVGFGYAGVYVALGSTNGTFL